MACIVLIAFEMVLVMALSCAHDVRDGSRDGFHVAHVVQDGSHDGLHGDPHSTVAHGALADYLDVCDGVLQFHWTQHPGFVFVAISTLTLHVYHEQPFDVPSLQRTTFTLHHHNKPLQRSTYTFTTIT